SACDVTSLSANIAEVAAMSDLAFRTRFRSSCESSPSSTLPVWKRYRGTSELILDTNSEEEEDGEVEESSDSDSESEDEGPTAGDEGLAVEDEGLAAGDEGPGMRVKSLGLGGDEAVPEGQQQAAPVMETTMGEPLGLGYEALRRREIASRENHMPSDGRSYIDVPAYPPPAPPVQTPPPLEWLFGLLPTSSAPSVVPSPISSSMISLIIPSLVASPTTAKAEGFLAELGAQVEMQG
ncbi:hypothetical protein Tco_1099394, partial [Tanacetum coccineum]